MTSLLSIFNTMNWSNHATSDHWDTKKIKTIRYFILFLEFDLAKREASAPLARALAENFPGGG